MSETGCHWRSTRSKVKTSFATTEPALPSQDLRMFGLPSNARRGKEQYGAIYSAERQRFLPHPRPHFCLINISFHALVCRIVLSFHRQPYLSKRCSLMSSISVNSVGRFVSVTDHVGTEVCCPQPVTGRYSRALIMLPRDCRFAKRICSHRLDCYQSNSVDYSTSSRGPL